MLDALFIPPQRIFVSLDVMTRPRLAVSFLLLASCVSAYAAAPNANLLGTFASRRPPPNAYGTHGLVEHLEVTLDGDLYKLSAYMNVTNREGGMEHTSNTFWRWSGEGRLVGNVIRFTYEASFGGDDKETGRGSFRRSGSRYIVEVDGAKYTVRRKTPVQGMQLRKRLEPAVCPGRPSFRLTPC